MEALRVHELAAVLSKLKDGTRIFLADAEGEFVGMAIDVKLDKTGHFYIVVELDNESGGEEDE